MTAAHWLQVILLLLCGPALLWGVLASAGRASRREEYELEKAGLIDALRLTGRAPYTIWRVVCKWCDKQYRVERRPFEADLGVEVIDHGMCDDCLANYKREDVIDAIAADAIAKASSGETR